MKNSRLPDFFLIGAMKAGTSSLHYYLDQHPHISMSTIKEPNYFTKSRTVFHKSLRWYSNLFPDNKNLKGESSTAYTKYPHIRGVAERIAKKIKNPRFIYLLRHPVERTLSHVRHEMLEGLLPYRSEIDDYIRSPENNPYVDFSRYMMQLDQYLHIFPKASFLILTHDELRKDPATLTGKVFDFLGLEGSLDPSIYNRKRNVSAERTIITDRRAYKRDLGLEKMGLKSPGTADKRWREIFVPPSISNKGSTRLVEYLRPDLERLYQFCGEEFWPNIY